jgi:NNP family nitrate/nitrite transporter-like MFS transporter
LETRKREKAASIISYGLLIMTITHTLTHVFQRMPSALFPILMRPEEFNLSLQQIGIIAAIPPLCSALLSIPMGLLSDRYGSRKMVFVSMAVSALGALMASQASNPTMFIIAISLLSVNTTIYHPAAYSFTTKIVQPSDRPKALGIHGAGGTFGMSIGPISLSILMGLLAFRWRQVYFFWFIPLILGAIAVIGIKTEPTEYTPTTIISQPVNEEKPNIRSMLTTSLLMFLVFVGIRTIGRSMIGSFLPIYMVNNKGISESLTNIIYGSNTLMGLIAAPLGGAIATRFGEKRWLIGVLVLSYVCLGLSFVIPNTTAFIVLYLISGFFNFLGMAANSSIVAKLSPSSQRGLGYALFFLPGSAMGAVAPVIAASIGEAFGLASIFYASIAVYVLGLFVLHFGVNLKES